MPQASPASPTAADVPSATGNLFRSPLVISLISSAALAALFAGWHISGRSAEKKEAAPRHFLAPGFLPIIHARDELGMVLSSQNETVSRTRKQVEELRRDLDSEKAALLMIEKDIAAMNAAAQDASLAETTTRNRLEALNKILAAFKSAEQARASALKVPALSEAGNVSLERFQKEWEQDSAQAVTGLKTAEQALSDLEKNKAGWEARKASLTPQEKQDIKAAHEKTRKALEESNAAVAAAVDKLKKRFQDQQKELDAALAGLEASNPRP
jgi:hypothetical protein